MIKKQKKLSENQDKIISLLLPFGFTQEEAQMYLLLLSHESLSALEISRASGISRTKVYDILEKLQDKKFAFTVQSSSGKRYKAASHKQLEVVINQKKSEVESLESSIPTVYEQIINIETSSSTGSKIEHYKGYEGLKRVIWNSTRAKGILRVFEPENDLTAFMDFGVAEKVRQEWMKNGLKESRQLTNSNKIHAWTNISEFVDIWESRYIDSKTFSLNIDVSVYNNVVSLIQMKDRELFCVEIYNDALAEMQKMLFDEIWNKATKMKKIDERGTAILV